ncbi:trypsin-like peptidase domain-containing protein [Chitinophaga japonensis]|uniref:S1-C subfamily serine protease n=1 Tax=Chitinophaga japonensis TaxID=104662 RepID=A0A562SSE6_CHIJA|nr:trypsin-like peptidase domain-containing protein [Chitinophaga japonensis]TWI84132.1 S1-C subfamily serine protease [Chitinophaga japonensis]
MKKALVISVLFLLPCLPALPGLAQEKEVRISSGRLPFVPLEERQQQALAGEQPAPSRGPAAQTPGFRYAAGKVIPGVVHIVAVYKPGFRGQPLNPFSTFYNNDMWPNARRNVRAPEGSASGVLLSGDGYIVTNCHVVQNARSIAVILHDKRSFEAQVIGMDSLTDLALLKIPAARLPFVAFGSTDSIAVGDWVLAVGNPFNLASTVTAGIVSAKSRNINTLEEQGGISSFIQTDAVMNNGNSGGALVDLDGKLIGINTGIITPNGSYTGYAFSIPVEVVRKVSNDLLRYGAAYRAYMGVFLKDVPDRYGVYVDSLVKEGAAMQAGIRPGDIITRVAAKTVESVAAFHETMILHHPGDKVIVTVVRKQREIQLQTALNGQEETAAGVANDPEGLLQLLGIEVMDIFRQEKEQLQLKGGLRVIKVRHGRIFRSTSIEPGFIILEVNNQPVSSREDLFNALRYYKGRVLVAGIYPDYPHALYYAAFTL